MTEPLFYLATLPAAGAAVTLSGDEAHHAGASRRLKIGDRLWLFDGHGTIARAAITGIAARRREIALHIEERRNEPSPMSLLHLACALPKGDRQAVLLDMATQLGMTRFTPLLCERSVVKPAVGALGRWRRICLEACKQSRRLHLPEIREPTTPREAAARAAAEGARVWIAHPSGGPLPLATAPKTAPDIMLLVGPEGGFTEGEIASAQDSGAVPVGLGPAILRIETAAVVLLAGAVLRPPAGHRD
jgi:16S rRNA (uracil1498-N3)-methyltransferase